MKFLVKYNWLYSERIKLLLLIAVAVISRAIINFSTDLMPGLMSAYYPIQVRALLETGQLGFPDFPVVFYLQAGLAKLLQILGFCDLDSCVMFSSKFLDAALYPLIAIPIFLLAKNILHDRSKHDTKSSKVILACPESISKERFSTRPDLISGLARMTPLIPLMAAALVTISGPAFVMMADFQKNSLGLTWSAFYIYFLYKAVQESRLKNYLLAGAFFILTGLTHIGGLGLIIAFTLSYLLVTFIFEQEKRTIILKILGLLMATAALVTLVLFFSDPERLNRLKDVFLYPLTMFQDSMIKSIWQGRVPLMTTLLDLTLPNILAIYALILLISKRKEINNQDKGLFLSLLLLIIFLASPFLKEELGNRLYKMAYLPMAVIFSLSLKYILARKNQIIFTALVLITMIGSAPIVGIVRGQTNITNAAFQDLSQLKTVITKPDKTLIVTRHGLEFWTAWVLKVEVGSQRSLSREAWEKYEEIYYLQQKTGQGNFGPFGPGGPSFPEVEIPANSEIVYEDEFYILAKALPESLPEQSQPEKSPRPLPN